MKAVLWDLDGVLFDTEKAHYEVWAKILGEHQVFLDYDQFLITFGMKNQDFLPLLFGHPLQEEFMETVAQEKERRFRQTVARGEVSVMPGVVDWLQRFRAIGCRQAVASSAPPENIEVMLMQGNLQGYFDAVVSSKGLPGKPDPAIFLAAARTLKIPAQDCLVIEDSLMGIEAAQRAGMKCLAVANTYPAEKLQSANLVAASLQDLRPEDLAQLV